MPDVAQCANVSFLVMLRLLSKFLVRPHASDTGTPRFEKVVAPYEGKYRGFCEKQSFQKYQPILTDVAGCMNVGNASIFNAERPLK